jgi:hypothetical protein
MRVKAAKPRDPAVEAYVKEQEGALGETTRFLVDLVRATVPASTEAIYHGSPKFCVEDGTVFCYVAAYTRYVNLGFIQGATMDDPDGLLEGTGKGLRHVKIEGPKAVPKAKLVKLLKQAAKAAAVKPA